MNKIRTAILAKISEALMFHYLEAVDLNNEFISRSRGHGRNLPFIKSVHGNLGKTTDWPLEKRNGLKERTRRLNRL